MVLGFDMCSETWTHERFHFHFIKHKLDFLQASIDVEVVYQVGNGAKLVLRDYINVVILLQSAVFQLRKLEEAGLRTKSSFGVIY